MKASQTGASIYALNPDQWEESILTSARQRDLSADGLYATVKRLGGAGDGGRDVEARYGQAFVRYGWDLYQAKHYGQGLTQRDAFSEIEKFFKLGVT